MSPKCSLMFQQPNDNSYFLTGTSLPPKLSADSQWLPWDTSLSLCTATCSSQHSLLICKFQLSMSTPQPLVASPPLLILTWLADRAWCFTLVPSWFVMSFHSLKSLGCLSYKCWIESLPFLERSWSYILSHFFFSQRMAAWEKADRLTAADPVSHNTDIQPRAGGTQWTLYHPVAFGLHSCQVSVLS